MLAGLAMGELSKNNMFSHAHQTTLAASRLHAACACASVKRFTPGSTARKYERSRPFQVTHLALDLDVDMKSKSVSGTATLDFVRRAPSGKELRLDAHGFQIEALRLKSGKAAFRKLPQSAYSYDGDEITVSLDEEVKEGTLEVSYRAVPRLGLYFLSPDKAVPNRPQQVWSQCQDEDGKFWFPCQDKPHVKMTYELKARVPRGMICLSGGELISESRPSKGAWEFHFKLDVATPAYLITLVVGKFDEWDEEVILPSGKKLPLRYLVPPGALTDGKRAFSGTAEAIRVFSERTGVEFPFARYSQVVVADFIFGGMENTTATTMYEHILINKAASLDIESHDLVAHELAHQWFGDLVTCRDWSHAWLNEGFATYFEHVELENRLGVDEYEQNVTVDLNQYLGEAHGSYMRPIVCRDYDEPIDLFDRHLYQKGGLVLHMLRRRLGDECFWQAISVYLKKHRGGIVETTDLRRCLEDASGLSLERFFDEWVMRPGHPELKVHVTFEGGALTIDVEQTQKSEGVAVFELPFEVEVCIDGQVQRLERNITERKSSLLLKCDKRPDWFALDPDYKLAAPFTLSAPADMLRNLLEKGPRPRARRLAALALAKRQDPSTVEALSNCLHNEKEAWMVRAKAADSLSRIRGDEAEATLTSASQTSHPKVRRAVAEALGAFRSPAVGTRLIALTKDKSYLVAGAAARSLGRTGDGRATKILTALLRKDSWADVIRAGALAGLADTRDESAVPTLMEWTEYGKPLRARRAALNALPRLGEGKQVREHLIAMLEDHDPHIRSAVLNALGALGDEKARSAIQELESRELDGGVLSRAREVLGELGKDGIKGLKEARHQNQKLERELGTLKTRLEKLEQHIAPQSPKKNPQKKGASAKKSVPAAKASRRSTKKPRR